MSYTCWALTYKWYEIFFRPLLKLSIVHMANLNCNSNLWRPLQGSQQRQCVCEWQHHQRKPWRIYIRNRRSVKLIERCHRFQHHQADRKDLVCQLRHQELTGSIRPSNDLDPPRIASMHRQRNAEMVGNNLREDWHWYYRIDFCRAPQASGSEVYICQARCHEDGCSESD